MKANFALSLSFDGIRLLHRAAGGWRFVGEVELTDSDLGGALSGLRDTALTLEPDGLRTKLIIPDSQIRYLTIDTDGREGSALDDAALRALDGATPYAVEDLAFDLTPDGAQTHIAAVAKETLAEAEGFALEHGFDPISAVAVPETAPFLGEPFFGATKHAESLLASGEAVEADGIAVVVLEPDGPSAVVEVEIEAEDPDVEPELATRVEDPAAPEEEEPEPVSADPEPEADPVVARVDPAPEPAASPIETAVPMPGFTSRRNKSGSVTPTLGGVTRETPPPAVDEANAPRAPDIEAQRDDPRPDLAARIEVPADDRIAAPTRQSETNASNGLLARIFARSSTAEPALSSGAAPASNLADELRMTNASSVRAPTAQSERQRMTVFGARKPEGDVAVGGKPRFLGLILTAVLLVFLAGVAAFAALEEGISSLFAPRETPAPVLVEDLPAPEAEIAAPVELAALDDAELLLEEDPAPLVDPQGPPPFDPIAAEAQYAITGIWTIPPQVPQAPPMLALEDLYIASINRRSPSFDAVALAPGASFGTDEIARDLRAPAPPGTRYELDARGLVIPTPQGVLSPDGIRVFAGRPPVVPPERPIREVAPTPEAQPQPELAAFRPRLRPTDLVESNERELLGGLSLTELSQLRPRLRPETTKQAEEDLDVATTEAVMASPRPPQKPRNFARIVERARKAAPEPTQVAAVAPRTVTPRVPSKTSVAREATVRNAIKLNRINLMGVFGTPSDRRALVRLSNGRYKKVKVGDRIDGGRVSAIGDSELRYQKGGRNIVLKMPRT